MSTRALTGWIGQIGAGVGMMLERLGRFFVFAFDTVSFVPVELCSRQAWSRLMLQCLNIGTRSVPVIMITGMFVGMVLAVQAYKQFESAGLGDQLGVMVNMSVVAELGPVLAGVMLAGRVGGALTAELGTMNVTEQLLALRSMGAEPVRFLATPRFLACLLLTPLLTCYADLMGAFGGWLITVQVYGQESGPYWEHSQQFIELWDVLAGLTKALFFGGVIGLISCYNGFNCQHGAEGVGRACTQGFVASFIAILTLDFFLNIVINGLYERWYGFKPLL